MHNTTDTPSREQQIVIYNKKKKKRMLHILCTLRKTLKHKKNKKKCEYSQQRSTKYIKYTSRFEEKPFFKGKFIDFQFRRTENMSFSLFFLKAIYSDITRQRVPNLKKKVVR